MSRQELLAEILRLNLELSSERSHREVLERGIVAAGGEVFKTTPDGETYTPYGLNNTVLERRPYRNGHLTKEFRRNKKTGTLTGPYWQYRGVEDGKQVNLYLGKTDDPEATAEEKLGRRRR